MDHFWPTQVQVQEHIMEYEMNLLEQEQAIRKVFPHLYQIQMMPIILD